MKRKKRKGHRKRKKRRKSLKSRKPKRAQRKRRKESEPSLIAVLGGLALDVVKGIGSLVKEVTKATTSRPRKHEQYERGSSAYISRSELKSLIAKEGHRRGLEGEPPEYVIRYAENLLESEEVDFEKAVEEAVDYWEETDAYRRAMD